MPWQYYAISDTECLTRYNVTPRLGPPTYKRDDEVICTSYYSRLVPLEHGEVSFLLISILGSVDEGWVGVGKDVLALCCYVILK